MPVTVATFYPAEFEDGFLPLTDAEAGDGVTLADKITHRLGTWLAEAAAKTTNEDAQAEWVRFRANSAKAQSLALTPASFSVGSEVSQATNHREQIGHFRREAADARARFDALAATAEPDRRPRSRSVARTAAW